MSVGLTSDVEISAQVVDDQFPFVSTPVLFVSVRTPFCLCFAVGMISFLIHPSRVSSADLPQLHEETFHSWEASFKSL